MAKVTPSQRVTDKPREAWVAINKKTGAIVTAHCTCMAGYVHIDVCVHINKALFLYLDLVKYVLMWLVYSSRLKLVSDLE